jgi:hypothetical protein
MTEIGHSLWVVTWPVLQKPFIKSDGTFVATELNGAESRTGCFPQILARFDPEKFLEKSLVKNFTTRQFRARFWPDGGPEAGEVEFPNSIFHSA